MNASEPDMPAMERRLLRSLRVGSSLPSRARTITEADITMFCALTGDWHPQHSDAEWAKSSLFGERIAHGLLTLYLGPGLLRLDCEEVIALRRLSDVVFKRPVRIGDTIRLRAVVEHVRPVRRDTALLGLRWQIVNSCERTVLRAQVELLIRAAAARADVHRSSAEADLSVPGVIPF